LENALDGAAAQRVDARYDVKNFHLNNVGRNLLQDAFRVLLRVPWSNSQWTKPTFRLKYAIFVSRCLTGRAGVPA
jgi:hypothetical protein